MGFKFNPFSGNFDQTGSGGGGASYIDGEVQNFSALPQTVGSPAVDSAYLVREAEGAWLLNRKPAGIYIRTANTGTRASDWTYAGEFPDVFNDANLVVYNNTDSTKNVKFNASAIATGTTRTITVPNKNITLDDAGDSRTPTAHAASHASAGSDPVSIDPSQITNLESAILDAISTGNTVFARNIAIKDAASEFTGKFRAEDDSLTANRTYDLPDRSGELMIVGDAPASHTHGNLTNDGKIGSTAGLPLVTTTAGAVTTLALGTAGQVLTVNSGATGVEFAAASGGGVSSVASSASDVLGVSGANITGVDAGSADRLVFWDDSANKLTYLEAGSGLSISGTTLTASGGLNAMQSIAINFVLN